MKKVVFVNVDTQKDFMLKAGKLYVPGAERIIPQLDTLTKLANSNKVQVLNTCDLHYVYSKELTDNPDEIDGITKFPPHCLIGSVGQEFIDETTPMQFKEQGIYIVNNDEMRLDYIKINNCRNIIVQKDAFDVFSNKFMEGVLNAIKADIFVVYGVTTQICVDHVIMGLLKRNKKVVAIIDALKDLPRILPGSDHFFAKWRKEGATLTSVKFMNLFYKLQGID